MIKKTRLLIFAVIILLQVLIFYGCGKEKKETENASASTQAEFVCFTDIIPPSNGLPLSWLENDAYYLRVGDTVPEFEKAVWTKRAADGSEIKLEKDEIFEKGKAYDVYAYFKSPGFSVERLSEIEPLSGDGFRELTGDENEWCLHYSFSEDASAREALLLYLPEAKENTPNTAQESYIAVLKGMKLPGRSVEWTEIKDKQYEKPVPMERGQSFQKNGVYQTTVFISPLPDISLSEVYVYASSGCVTHIDDSREGLWRITVEYNPEMTALREKKLPEKLLADLKDVVPINDIWIINPKVTKEKGPFEAKASVSDGVVADVKWFKGLNAEGEEMTPDSWQLSCTGYSEWMRVEMISSGILDPSLELKISSTEGSVASVELIDAKSFCVVINYSYEHALVFNEAASLAPSCVSPGVNVYSCANCFDEILSELGPLPHEYYQVGYVPPSCHAAGYSVYRCFNCGETYTVGLGFIPHSFVMDEAAGVRVCTVCGYTESPGPEPGPQPTGEDPGTDPTPTVGPDPTGEPTVTPVPSGGPTITPEPTGGSEPTEEPDNEPAQVP